MTSDCGGFCNGGRCNVVTNTNGQSNTVCCDNECAAGCTAGTASDCNVSECNSKTDHAHHYNYYNYSIMHCV